MSCEVGSWISHFSAFRGQPSWVGQMLRVGTFLGPKDQHSLRKGS